MIKEYAINSGNTDGEYLDLIIIDCPNSILAPVLQVTVDARLFSTNKKLKCKLVVNALDENDESIAYQYYPLDIVYHLKTLDDRILVHFPFRNDNFATRKIKVYLWNQNRAMVGVKSGKCYLYDVKSPETWH